MQRSVTSATLVGVEARLVEVEADISGGLPSFVTVGLAETAVRESRVRVQAAVSNSGFVFPTGRISVNLAPAHVRKDGTGLDLPVALAILAADDQLPAATLEGTLFVGELSLSGDLRPVRGTLAAVEAARQAGLKRALVAEGNAPEAALVSGIEVRAVRTFADAGRFLREGYDEAAPIAERGELPALAGPTLDLAEVRGQPLARRALEVAAAGGHNLLFSGGPGAGKTMLARRLPGILPVLSEEEALEVTRIHSAAGLTLGGALVHERPFRAPHHSTTAAGLVGGGSGAPRPGEISLAHRGVLFLDELPEFPRAVLEVLRQPLESGDVRLSRAAMTVRYPAAVQLVAAMNPCPCGYAGSPRRACRCSSFEVERYRGRLSGPLLDRIDLQVTVPPVDFLELDALEPGESSAVVRARVVKAREVQAQRLGPARTNASMGPDEVRRYAALDDRGRHLLARATERLGLSARAWGRLLRVARTVADLDGAETVEARHMAEALSYRGFDGPRAQGGACSSSTEVAPASSPAPLRFSSS